MPEPYVVQYDTSDDMVEPVVNAVIAADGVGPSPFSTRFVLATAGGTLVLVGYVATWSFREEMPWYVHVVAWVPIVGGVLTVLLHLFIVLGLPWYRRTCEKAVRDGMLRSGAFRERWTFSSAGLSLEEGPEVREITWNDVKYLFVAPQVWVLKTRADRPIWFLWRDALPDEVAEFIRARARIAGVPIRTADSEAGPPDIPKGRGVFP